MSEISAAEQAEDLGHDAVCDYCETRASDEKTGPLTEQQADTWGYWHQQECKPEIKILAPADLQSERESLARLKERYPEMFADGETS